MPSKVAIFRVEAANHYFSIHVQENGIPQGSPLSGTLFLIAINEVTKIIKAPFHSILFSQKFHNSPRRYNSIPWPALPF